MKCRKTILKLAVVLAALLGVSACGSQKTAELANELTFSMNGIEELTISYDDEDIRFFENENDSLMIREYMNKNKKSYHAKVSQKKDSIKVSEGGKPFFKGGFLRYVEVYLPASYSKSLKLTATDGTIDMSMVELNMDSVRVDCTSGTFRLKKAAAENLYFSSTSGNLELGNIAGGQIRIETTQGNVSCERAAGTIAYTSTSGDAKFCAVSGSGTYRADNSGKLSVAYEEVTGDLYFYNKNDDMEISLPPDLSFSFEAVTKNGSVSTDFQSSLSVNGNTAEGTVGNHPSVNIKVETKNGNAEVKR